MGAVNLNSAGAEAIRPAGFASAVSQHGLPRICARLRGALSVCALRARLGFRPGEWLARFPAAATAAFDRIGRTIEQLSWHAVKAAVRAIRWRKVALVASAPFVLPAEWRGAFVRILAYLGAICALSVAASEFFRQPAEVGIPEAAPRPAWIEVDNPWAAFQLTASGFDKDDSAYAIRRHPQGGGRKDIFSFGELGKTRRFMNFEIYRAGGEAARFGSPAEEIRALGSEQGRVLGIRSSMPIASKFGPFQTFEFGIGPFGGYNCIGFVRAYDNPRVQISGLSCSMNLLVDRSSIACALDHLTLISAGSDPDIAKLFAHAEQKRHFCGQRDPLLYRTPKRPNDATNAVSSSLRLRGVLR
ncbi:MAG: hypothetical protein ABW198_05095 [Pseudorhodoplanes sp.]